MKTLRALTVALLIFNGLSAIGGGAALVFDPTGKLMQMPLSLLQQSPFNDFLMPGMLLFLFNGVSSLLIAFLVTKGYRYHGLLVAGQGLASVTWIVTQVMMIHAISWLHYLYGGIGVALWLAGVVLIKRSP